MNRRRMLAAAAACGLGTPVLTACSATHRSASASASVLPDDSPELRNAVAEGVSYFAKRCDDQLPLVIELERAINSGNLDTARRAYVESRPPYEEIETLAYAFEDSDRDIDARPYAFNGGETDGEFRGFHKIEAFLFGYEELEAAAPFASRLVASVRQLRRELSDLSRFNAAGQFGGMFALSNEVAAKKISSEEETWSDQTLLIFRHNWIGIYSQFKPFAGLVENASPGRSDAVRDAYDNAMALLRPHFRAGTAAGTPYSEIRMRERREMADASNRLRDAIQRAGEAIGIEV